MKVPIFQVWSAYSGPDDGGAFRDLKAKVEQRFATLADAETFIASKVWAHEYKRAFVFVDPEEASTIILGLEGGAA